MGFVARCSKFVTNAPSARPVVLQFDFLAGQACMSVLVYEMMLSSNNRSASVKGLYGLKKQQTKQHAFFQLSIFQHFIKISCLMQHHVQRDGTLFVKFPD